MEVEFTIKAKMFLMVVLEICLLTWDNIQCRSWMGPNICLLCQFAGESINHLFVYCSFCQNPWKDVYEILILSHVWGLDSYEFNFLK